MTAPATTTIDSALNMTTLGSVISSTASLPSNADSMEDTPIFLQTKSAQGIAGVFVWIALFLTCQQVLEYLFKIF